MSARSSNRHPASGAGLPVWKLEDAKSRFSELVRLARERGPQRVTVRGQDAVVVLSAADYASLSPIAAKPTLAGLFGDSPFSRMDSLGEEPVREQASFREPLEF